MLRASHITHRDAGRPSIEDLADQLDRLATETITLALMVRRKAEEIGKSNERRGIDARNANIDDAHDYQSEREHVGDDGERLEDGGGSTAIG